MSNFFKHCDGDHFSLTATSSALVKCLLIYQDNGNGYPTGFTLDNLDTLGLELIEILSEQMDGSMKFLNQNGARVEIEICV